MKSVWTPTVGVSGHHGLELSSKLVFPAAPPQEIGRVTSAFSSIREDDKPTTTGRKAMLLVGIGIITCLIAIGVRLWFAATLQNIPLWVMASFGFCVGAAFCLNVFAESRPMCSYVGRQGIARLMLDSQGMVIANQSKTFLFNDADDASLAVLEKASKGLNTIVVLEWRRNGEEVYRSSYCLDNQPTLPKPATVGQNPGNTLMDCYFSIAAHAEWKNHITRDSQAKQQQNEHL